MDYLDSSVKVIIAVFAVASAYMQLRPESKGRRQRLKFDTEMLHLLSENSPGRSLLEQHIDRQIAELVEREAPHLRRDNTRIVLGLFFLGLGVYMALLAFRGGYWTVLWLAVAILLLIGAFGLADGLKKCARDSRGNPIKINEDQHKVEPLESNNK